MHNAGCKKEGLAPGAFQCFALRVPDRAFDRLLTRVGGMRPDQRCRPGSKIEDLRLKDDKGQAKPEC